MAKTFAALIAALGLVAALVTASIGTASADDRPDPHIDPIADGCQRSDLQMLTLTTPEWVYVHGDQVRAQRAADPSYKRFGTRTVKGEVKDVHPAGDDLYVNHHFNDLDWDVTPDPAYISAVEQGDSTSIGAEWEESLIPQWAWPNIGDHVTESGSWIWDCGHFGGSHIPDPLGLQSVLGEQTELHPIFEIASVRNDVAGLLGSAGPRALARLDAWINGDGGPAMREEECALQHIPPLSAATPVCSNIRDVGGAYSYTLPLRPRPAGGNLIVEMTERDANVAGVTPTWGYNPDNTVSVSFTLPHSDAAQRYGLSVNAGWDNDATPIHHTVTLDSVHINRSLDGDPALGGSEPSQNPVANGPERTPGPGEWVGFANVSGYWQQIPGITQVNDGDTIPLGMTWDIWLPQGVSPTLYVSARECDIPLMDCTSDVFGGSPGAVPFAEVGYNDHPGRVHAGNDNLGVPMTLGTATYQPSATSPKTSIDEMSSDYTCGLARCYFVTATSS